MALDIKEQGLKIFSVFLQAIANILNIASHDI